MMLWPIFALMSTAASVALLWPLTRKPRASAGSDVHVYRDQLEEIDRDRGAGLIGEAEAQAARVEVSRRLLAAAGAPPPAAAATPLWRRRSTAVAILLVLLLLPAGLYGFLGSPDVPGQPAAARTAAPAGDSVAAMIGQVEQRLAQRPDDGAGWQVIAPVYLQLGRFDDAVMAFRKSLALNGETPARDSDLGEALVAAANGVVTDEAKRDFERATARNPREPKARYFLGLVDAQDGHPEAAATKWRALLDEAPVDAPWAAFVRQALARVTGHPVAGPVQQDPQQGAQDGAAAERDAMIRAMVEKLAASLHANGGDVEGWLRLVRSYAVLGQSDKAKTAATEARRALAGHPDEVKRIDDLLKGLGLAG